MDEKDKIRKLEEYKAALLEWQQTRDGRLRSLINQQTVWVEREVREAGCFHTLTISPPPVVGGLIMRGVNAFDMMFSPHIP